jgi:muramoyltetrapeptide carboxypeptidase
MSTITPPKLRPGSHVRVVAPSRSLQLIDHSVVRLAQSRLEHQGFSVSFGRHVHEHDSFQSSSIEARLYDIHDAFADRAVDGILSVIGGYNSNQLLSQLDYGLIADNPKLFCGYSDITTLCNAMLAKSGLVTYCGPHFSSWGMKEGFDYSVEGFTSCCVLDAPYTLEPAPVWSDDAWYADQENRNHISNGGYWLLSPGRVTGRLVGGHARSFAALKGSEFWPGLDGAILLLEETAAVGIQQFDQILTSLMILPEFSEIRGLLVGRFQVQSHVTRQMLAQVFDRKELKGIPIIANIDVGHTTPVATLPIGGVIDIAADDHEVSIRIVEH